MTQGIQPRSTKIDRNPTLKATAWTTILDVKGQGDLIGIAIRDPDDLTQNENLRITIDGAIVLSAPHDAGTTYDRLNIQNSIIENAITAWANVNETDNAIPFARTLKVEYSRTAAGTTGLDINILYDITETGLETVT